MERENLLTPTEAAVRLRVDQRTVKRWADQGKLKEIRLPNGYRRYRADDVEALLRGETGDGVPD